MIICRWIWLSLLFFPLLLHGQEEKISDSLQMNVIEIRAEKLFKSGDTYTDLKLIRLKKNESLDHLLNIAIPGVYIKSNGPGSSSTLTYRGTDATHSIMAINGIRLNNPTLGMADLSLFPVFISEGLGINRTGGMNDGFAVPGLVADMDPFGNWQRGREISGLVEAGSFNSYGQFLNYRQTGKAFESGTKVYHRYAKNDFKYSNTTRTGSPVERMANAEFRQYGVFQTLRYKLDQNNLLTFVGWFQDMEREIPPLLSSPVSRQKQEDRMIFLNGGYNKYFRKTSLSLKAAFSSQTMVYADPLMNIRESYLSNTITGNMKYAFRLFKINSEVIFFTEKTMAEADNLADNPSQDQHSATLSLRRNFNRRLTTGIKFQQPLINNQLMPFIPSLDIVYSLIKNKEYLVYTTGRRVFRYPSMNDLYWKFGGNPELFPETGWMAEGGLKNQNAGKIINWDFSLYYGLVENRIIWMPAGLFWSPVNIKRARLYGGNAIVSFHKKTRDYSLISSWKYSYSKALNDKALVTGDKSVGKQLIYVPVHSGSAYISYTRKGWEITPVAEYTGRRFYTTSNTLWLPGFLVFNLAIEKSINLPRQNLDLGIKGEVNNMLDEDYMMVRNRPMPGRNFLISITFKHLKNK